MNRRTAFLSLAVLSVAIFAFPRASLAQSSSLIGTWKINLEKSKFTPGTAPMGRISGALSKQSTRRGTPQRPCSCTFMMGSLTR